MDWRVKELSFLEPQIEWLAEAEAQRVSERVDRINSHEHYGLDAARVRDLERINVDDYASATHWLRARIPGECTHLLVAFGRFQVCRLPVSIFLAKWSNILLPSRDDAVIFGAGSNWVACYCHEEEFEFGWTSD